MPSPFTIVAFGDSMTECKALEPSARWPGLLQRRLNRASAGIRCTVINVGAGGNTSREGLARLERDVLPHRPDLTLVQFGGNDATPNPARAVTFDEYVRNLGAIRRRLRRAGSATAWMTFPPVIDAWHDWSDPANTAAREKFLTAGGVNGYLHEYRRRTRAFASRHGDLCIDLYAGMRQAIEEGGAGRYVVRDGVHFTVAGSRRAAEVVAAALQAFVVRAARGRAASA